MYAHLSLFGKNPLFPIFKRSASIHKINPAYYGLYGYQLFCKNSTFTVFMRFLGKKVNFKRSCAFAQKVKFYGLQMLKKQNLTHPKAAKLATLILVVCTASVSEMLHYLGWQSLDSRRQDQRLVLFYKIINGLASVETEDIITPADSRTRKNHSFKFKHLQANCDSYRLSFFPATISSWNNLPFGIEKVDSVEGFKLKLKEHTIRSP